MNIKTDVSMSEIIDGLKNSEINYFIIRKIKDEDINLSVSEGKIKIISISKKDRNGESYNISCILEYDSLSTTDIFCVQYDDLINLYFKNDVFVESESEMITVYGIKNVKSFYKLKKVG